MTDPKAVERHSYVRDTSRNAYVMAPDKGGVWVRYEDHRARVDALEAEGVSILDGVAAKIGRIDELEARIKELERERDEARETSASRLREIDKMRVELDAATANAVRLGECLELEAERSGRDLDEVREQLGVAREALQLALDRLEETRSNFEDEFPFDANARGVCKSLAEIRAQGAKALAKLQAGEENSHRPVLVVEIDVPDGATEDEVGKVVAELTGALDSTYRERGGSGLKVLKVSSFENREGEGE